MHVEFNIVSYPVYINCMSYFPDYIGMIKFIPKTAFSSIVFGPW